MCVHLAQILDDGGDATDRLRQKRPATFAALKGVVEESVMGVYRLHQLARAGKLTIPAMNVNACVTKVGFADGYENTSARARSFIRSQQRSIARVTLWTPLPVFSSY